MQMLCEGCVVLDLPQHHTTFHPRLGVLYLPIDRTLSYLISSQPYSLLLIKPPSQHHKHCTHNLLSSFHYIKTTLHKEPRTTWPTTSKTPLPLPNSQTSTSWKAFTRRSTNRTSMSTLRSPKMRRPENIPFWSSGTEEHG